MVFGFIIWLCHTLRCVFDLDGDGDSADGAVAHDVQHCGDA